MGPLALRRHPCGRLCFVDDTDFFLDVLVRVARARRAAVVLGEVLSRHAGVRPRVPYRYGANPASKTGRAVRPVHPLRRKPGLDGPQDTNRFPVPIMRKTTGSRIIDMCEQQEQGTLNNICYRDKGIRASLSR